MKYRIDIDEGVVALPRIVRLLVVIFCPWLALWVARKQLWIACLVIRNEGMARFPEHHTLIRWGNEILRDGRMEPQPDTEPNTQEVAGEALPPSFCSPGSNHRKPTE